MSVSEFTDKLLLEIAETCCLDSNEENLLLLTDYGPSALLSQILIYIDFLENYGMSSLIWVVSHNYVPLVKLLLNTGAEINAQNKQGYTALHVAVFMNNAEMVELLLQYEGINVNHQSVLLQTPLHCAAYCAREDSGDDTEEVVRLLIEGGADISIPGYKGYTAYMQARNTTVDVKRLLQPKDEAS